VSQVLQYYDTQENFHNKTVYASFTNPFIECTLTSYKFMFVVDLCCHSYSGRILNTTLDSKAWVTLGHFIAVNQWIPLNLGFNV
jgi:hypothetical protein